MDYLKLSGKTVLITGAASGIGKAAAKILASAGANVVIADFSEKGQEAADEIVSDGGSAMFVRTDVSDEDQVSKMVRTIVSKYGVLDAAVNNAALAPDTKAIAELDEKTWQRILSVDLMGTSLCMKYEIQQMMTQSHGSIVNISSAIAGRPSFNSAGYTAAKAAVRGLTKAGALEAGQHGIRVNCVSPAGVETPMLRQWCEEHHVGLNEAAKTQTALARFCQPEEIASAIVWLCSDASSFVTAVNLDVDGGYAIL